jgi:RNA polymerase sigma factor (sigma-70 family)
VRAFEKGVQFTGQSQAELEAWLARLLGNLHANHVRDLSRWRDEEHLKQIAAHGTEGEWRVEARETFRLLLRLLSDEEKVVIGLWIGGWTWNEIGDVLGISAEAARKRKDRAIPDLVKGFLRAGEPRWRLVRN